MISQLSLGDDRFIHGPDVETYECAKYNSRDEKAEVGGEISFAKADEEVYGPNLPAYSDEFEQCEGRFVATGCPLGESEFISNGLDRRLQIISVTTQSIDSQEAYVILRFCVNSTLSL